MKGQDCDPRNEGKVWKMLGLSHALHIKRFQTMNFPKLNITVKLNIRAVVTSTGDTGRVNTDEI